MDEFRGILLDLPVIFCVKSFISSNSSKVQKSRQLKLEEMVSFVKIPCNANKFLQKKTENFLAQESERKTLRLKYEQLKRIRDLGEIEIVKNSL